MKRKETVIKCDKGCTTLLVISIMEFGKLHNGWQFTVTFSDRGSPVSFKVFCLVHICTCRVLVL